MIAHQWQPITGLYPESAHVDFQEINSLHQQWTNFREQRESSNPDAYKAFRERLERRWAIETGIIEGLYTLDRDVTETLVKNGLIADLIEYSSTNRDPEALVTVLKDHQDTVTFVTESIRRGTQLSKHYIRQLHQILTRNQPTYTAVDQFGRKFETALDRGGFKTQPNNPTRREDGLIHEYCPPIQVESELDNLISWYNEYQHQSTAHHQLLVAAWLHHRFTQIHPFQDGNGRVARALLTWHLIKDGYLPIVISRDDRTQYLNALESADTGNLSSFIELIIQLEKQTILQAISEPESQDKPALVDQVLDHIVEQIQQQKQDKTNQMRLVNNIAINCRDFLATVLENEGAKIRQRLLDVSMDVHPYINKGGLDVGAEHYYADEVGTLAKMAMHEVNWSEPRVFVRLSLRVRNSHQPRLIFVICMYPTGRNLTGIMTAIAFARIEPSNSKSNDEEEQKGPYYRNCAIDPLTFTWQDDDEALKSRFAQWTEGCLSLALRYWQESMI